ncbi:MAG: hypothetical protein F7C38_04415 [Desulfurococcales archaeon]|nr:hypothetical protein [Desulfurococcales archaeon]
MAVQDLLNLIQNTTQQISILAWAVFLLTWSIGWTLRGAPIPLGRLKRTGSSFIEDSVWAALWLALGSTIFSLITYLIQVITS